MHPFLRPKVLAILLLQAAGPFDVLLETSDCVHLWDRHASVQQEQNCHWSTEKLGSQKFLRVTLRSFCLQQFGTSTEKGIKGPKTVARTSALQYSQDFTSAVLCPTFFTACFLLGVLCSSWGPSR